MEVVKFGVESSPCNLRSSETLQEWSRFTLLPSVQRHSDPDCLLSTFTGSTLFKARFIDRANLLSNRCLLSFFWDYSIFIEQFHVASTWAMSCGSHKASMRSCPHLQGAWNLLADWRGKKLTLLNHTRNKDLNLPLISTNNLLYWKTERGQSPFTVQ